MVDTRQNIVESMLFFRSFIPPLLLLLFSLLSCSSDGKYPYTIVEGDSYNTRLYRLPGGVKLYIARTTEQARVSAALYMPSVASDTLDNLYSEFLYSCDYPLLFARIGSEVSRVVDCEGSPIVYNNIPSNELQNWAVLMRGSFTVFPDSLSVVLSGDVVYDDAVAVITQCFQNVSFMQSSAADGADDAVALLAKVRTLFCNNVADGSKRIVTLSDICSDAKNSIKLLPSHPAKVIFPDVDKLTIKCADGKPRMVAAEAADTLFTFTIRTCLKEVPTSFLESIKEYFDASLATEKDSFAPAIQIYTDKIFHALEFSVSGSVENMQQTIIQAISIWKAAADGTKFYKYLLTNSGVLDAFKNSYENIAVQAAVYVAGGKRLCGLREMATYSMDALFSPSSELYFCGKGAVDAYSLYLKMLASDASPSMCDYSAPGDTVAHYLLLPVDADSIVTVILASSCASIEDYATIALFNKAASLSSTTPSAQFYPDGALLSTENSIPFTRETFEAAKSFLLYNVSTCVDGGLSLFKEYQLINEYGCSSSQLYGAFMRLDFSDAEDFYKRHQENSSTRLIIGRESSFNLRELNDKGKVVHLTSAELFGY